MARARSRPSTRRRALSPSEAIGAAGAAAILVCALASQLLDFWAYDLRVRLLDTNSDTGALGLLGAGAMFAAALSAGFVAMRFRHAASAGLAVLLTFLAVDHAAQLHAEVPRWRLAYLPLLALTFLVLVVVSRGPASGGGRVLLCGIALLAASLALHEIGGWLMDRMGVVPNSWAFQIKLALKHGTEAAGWFLVALGLVTAWRSRGADGAKDAQVPRRSRALARG